jgi:DNA invertase Pin-like site-specific DNA recombinase
VTKSEVSSAIEQWTVALDPILAAAYVRMSTEHQRYSIASQLRTIGEYAERRHIELCKVYEDAGKSGLTLEGRPGLTLLLEDIQRRRVEFSHLLVYDVSRWGRFQDADESAYYEFICRRHGITVIYCAEPFENDGSPLTVVLKSVKRAMAAEYSRELSVKIFAAQSLVCKSGQTPGGRVPYGLARVAVNPTGKYRKVLKRGRRRDVKADYLFLGPGLPHEIKVIREIFNLYANAHMSGNQIAAHLNEKGFRSPNGQPWTYQTVIYMLHNDKYIGTQAYNRTSVKMRSRRRRNDPSQWVEKEHAFEPIIDPQVFRRVQERLLSPHRRFSNEELIAGLRAFLESHQDLRVRDLKGLTGLASPPAYILRFGSVRKACELAGFPTASNFRAYDQAIRLRRIRYAVLHTSRCHRTGIKGYCT